MINLQIIKKKILSYHQFKNCQSNNLFQLCSEIFLPVFLLNIYIFTCFLNVNQYYHDVKNLKIIIIVFKLNKTFLSLFIIYDISKGPSPPID